jgi:high-affinity iron transporter
VWRESVEALLVVGLLHALLRQQQADGQALRFLWWGVAGGVAMAVALAVALAAALLEMGDLLGGGAQDVFATVLVWVAAALIVQMVLWMRVHGAQLHGHFQTRSGAALASGNYWGIAVLAAIAIGREGSETVIFLYGMSSAQQAVADWLGFAGAVLVAIALAGLTYWLLQAGGRWLSWRLFFRCSEVLLLLLAASLVMSGVDRMLSLGWLRAGIDPLWDSSMLLDDSTRFGGTVAALTGYRAYPAETGVIVYTGFWLLVAGLLLWQRRLNLRRQQAAT